MMFHLVLTICPYHFLFYNRKQPTESSTKQACAKAPFNNSYLWKILPVELLLAEPEVETVEGSRDLSDLLKHDVIL